MTWPAGARRILLGLMRQTEPVPLARNRAGAWLYDNGLIRGRRGGWEITAKGVEAATARAPRKASAKRPARANPRGARPRIRNDGLPQAAREAKVSAAELKKLQSIYKDMHWGAEAKKLIHVKDPLVPNLVAYGALTELKAGNKVISLGPNCWIGFSPKSTRRLYIVLSPEEREKVRLQMKYAGKLVPLQDIAKKAGGRQVKNRMPNIKGAIIGPLVHVVYDTEKLGEDTPGSNPYIHEHGKEHAKGVKPILAADASGRLWIVGGDYLCVEAGITG